MKRNKFYLALFALLAFAAFSFVISCTPTTGEYQITGVPTEINLKATDTSESFDFLNGITATLDGQEVTLTVDKSQITFGTSGSYEVTFSVGGETRTVPVKIYGTPVATVTELTANYSEIGSKIGTGISVKDSFGTELEVTIDQTSIKPNGYYQSGDLKFTATDKAGNVYNGTQSVVVNYTGGLTLDPITVDLSNVAVQIPATETLIAATLDDEVIGKQYVVQSGGNVVFTGPYIQGIGVGDYDVKLYFANTFGATTLKVTDTELPKFVVDTETNKDGINNYIFKKGEEIVLPTAHLAKNSYQNLEYVHHLLKNGQEITLDAFSSNEVGKYSYEVIATKVGDATKSLSIKQDFYVVLEEATHVYFDPVISNQQTQLWTSRTDIGSNLARVKETYTTESRYAMEYFNNATILDDTRSLYLNNEVIEAALNSGARTFSFDVMFHEIPAGSSATVGLMSTSVGYWVATRGMEITEVDKWYTLTFNLDSAFEIGLAELNGQYHVYEKDAYGDIKLRFDEFEIISSCTYVDENSEYKNKPHTVYFSNFQFGNTNSIAQYAGIYETADKNHTVAISNDPNSPVRLVSGNDITTYTYAKVYENGLVVASMDNTNLSFTDTIVGVVSDFWFDIDGVRYYKQLSSTTYNILVDKEYSIESLLDINKLGDMTLEITTGAEYAQFQDNTLIGLTAGQPVTLRLTYEPGVYVDLVVNILSDEAFYDRPFNSAEYEQYFLTDHPTNYAMYDEVENALKLVQTSTMDDDSRGFFLDRYYLNSMIARGFNYFTFKFKQVNYNAADLTNFNFGPYQYGDEVEYFYQGSRWNWRSPYFATTKTNEYVDVVVNLVDLKAQFNGDKTSFIFLKFKPGEMWIKDLTFTKTVDYADKTKWFSSDQGTVTYDATNDKFTAHGTGADMHFFLSSDVVQHYMSEGYESITFTVQSSNWQNNDATWKGFQIIGKENVDGTITDKWGYIAVNVVTSEMTPVTVNLLDTVNDWTRDVNFYTNLCEATDLYIYDMEFNKPVDYTDKASWFETSQGTISYDQPNDKFTVKGTGSDMHFFLKSEVVAYYLSEGYTNITLTYQNSNWQGNPETWKSFQVIGKKDVDGTITEDWAYVQGTPATSEFKTVTLDLLDPNNIWTMDVEFYTNLCENTDLWILDMEFNKPLTDKSVWFETTQGTITYDQTNDKFTVKGTGSDMHFFLKSEVVAYYLSEGYTNITLTYQNSNWQGNPETWKSFQVIGKKDVDGTITEDWAYVQGTPATSEFKTVTLDLLDPNNIWTMDVEFYTNLCENTDLWILDMEFNKPVAA